MRGVGRASLLVPFTLRSGRRSLGLANNCFWLGRIAEVAIYEKALTPERVSAHFYAMPR